MPRARNASFGTSEKVTVAIGSTSSNMRGTLACGCGIPAPPVVVTAPSWAASHPGYEQRGPDPTTPAGSAGQGRGVTREVMVAPGSTIHTDGGESGDRDVLGVA